MPAALLDPWTRLVRSRPSARALADAATGEIWTRSDLDRMAGSWRDRIARDMAGARVAFALPNGADWLALFLGLMQSGSVAVPLDPSDPPATRRRRAAEIGADYLWSENALTALRPGGRRRRSPACLIKLTSGSTGAPRAFAFTDAEMLADGRQICTAMGIRPSDLNVGLIPFGHSYGLGNLVVPLLVLGTPILSGLSPLPQSLARDIERWEPTVFPAVPPVLRALAAAGIPRSRLASLRTVISAGAPLDPPLAREFCRRFSRRIHTFYGSSETGGIAYDRSGRAAMTAGNVGLPLPRVRLSSLPRGRFLVESPAVFTLGNRRRTRGLGRHSPPDLGRIESNGTLLLLGRSGRQVKIAGRRVDPREVEEAIRRLPAVADAWVAADPGRPDSLAAVVAGRAEGDRLRAALRAELAPWKIPRRFVIVADLPRSARGKADSARLQKLIGG